MIDFFLVRHGEAAHSWGEAADPGLSELGQRQAQNAGLSLLPEVLPNTALLSSPLARAAETAEFLANMTGQAVDTDAVFGEIPSPVPLEQRQDWLRSFMQQHWTEQPEVLLQWRAALLQRLMTLEQPAVIFTHFLAINAVVGQVQERTETLCFWPDNGSVTHVRRTDSGLELIALGAELETPVN